MDQTHPEFPLDGAQSAVDDVSTIILTRAGSLQLLELLENPPRRNHKFNEAQARYFSHLAATRSPNAD